MSDTKCVDCRHMGCECSEYRQRPCRRSEHETAFTWPDAYGCPSFERKRDRYEEVAEGIVESLSASYLRAGFGDYAKKLATRHLRRCFPEPDRAAIRKAICEKLAVGYWKFTADEITDAILSALRGEA